MTDPVYILESEKEESIFLREKLMKFLSYWPWFVGSAVLCLLIGLLYLRYAPVIYATEAKIKIIDDSKDFDIAEDALSLLGAGSKINLDNEIAVIKSYRIFDQVVTALNLDVKYYEVGNVKTQQIFEMPLRAIKMFPDDSLKKPITYKVSILPNQYIVTDPLGNTFTSSQDTLLLNKSDFPVKIVTNSRVNFADCIDKNFLIQLNNKKETVLGFMEDINVRPLSEKSDVLSITTRNESANLSEAILNQLISKFNSDGIIDRQLVSKRTLDFIDERFTYLSKELDSIEIDKEDYKRTNNLSYIEADAGMTIEKRSLAESEVFRIETQLVLSRLLKSTLNKQTDYSLLPADIGVENANINSLIFEYNQAVIQREKLVVSAGVNNPAVKLLSTQLRSTKKNIINTVNSYVQQLQVSLKQLKLQEDVADSSFAALPEKEKRLRSIERQQLIKENLFLLLLQKREEAAINFAVTAPSVKVVDYGLTSLKPVAPKKVLVLGMSLALGLFLPLAFFFVKESFDTKIKSKSDLERLGGSIPVIAEIPSLPDPDTFSSVDDRSIKAESFRILGTNIKYLLPNKKDGQGQIIYITSAIKGEGKTLTAINLATAFSSLKRRVLLIGADLRNPQLHNYYNLNRNDKGLSNYLHDPNIPFEDCIQKGVHSNPYLDICISGPIPPNATQLIAGDNLAPFFDYAREHYDFVVVDTAPTVLVADTLLMADLADVTAYITRSEFTDKRLIQFSKDLSESKKLKNVAYVLNDVKFNKNSGYNYGYEYGYGSSEDS